MGLYHRIDSPERLNAVMACREVIAECRPVIDGILRLAADEFGVSHAALTLVEERVVCFPVSIGGAFAPVPREQGFCTQVVAQGAAVVFPDLRAHAASARSPLVAGEPHLAFYAGAPVRVGEGTAIGSFCLFADKPRPDFGQRERARLERYAQLVGDLLSCARDRFAARMEVPDALRQEIVRLKHGLASLRSEFEQEILTPLHAAIGFARLIHQQAYGSIDNPLYRQYARHIATSVERVLRSLDRLALRDEELATRAGLNDNEFGVAPGEVLDSLLAARPEDERKRLNLCGGPQVRLVASARGIKQGIDEVLDWCLARAPAPEPVTIVPMVAGSGDLALLVARGAPAEVEERLAVDPPAPQRDEAREGRGRRELPLAQRLLAREEGRLELFAKADAPWLARIVWPAYRLLWKTGGGGDTSTPADSGGAGT